MDAMYILGAAAVLVLIAAVGIYSGSKIRKAEDFSCGGRSGGLLLTACALTGTLVGGASTIGTAQLAFTYGFSAWWYTLGGGIGLGVLGLIFAKPMYKSGHPTISHLIAAEYGKPAATLAAVLMSLGTFLSIVSQMLSGTALITSISPMPALGAAILVVALMTAYVMFGGVWGAGMAGIAKTALIYLTALCCGITALHLGGGWNSFTGKLPAQQYFNLFARGVWKDGGAGLSLLFGILTTQAYFLPIVSAKNIKTARNGAMLGGVLTTIIGVAGIFVGMYMRITAPDCDPAAVLPLFILEKMPPLLAGVMLATLLVVLVGTGAGLALGISTMLTQDIYRVRLRPQASDRETLLFSRLVIAAVLVCAGLFSFGSLGSMILNWSFLSMGLRGAVAFAPLCFALFSPGKVSGRTVIAAIVTGPLVVLIGQFVLPSQMDPLFPGIAATVLIMALGYAKNAWSESDEHCKKGHG